VQFLITAYDGKDSEAPARRAKVRPQHLEEVKVLADEGKVLYGAAILDDEGNMIGSIMVVDFPSLEALKSDWFNKEPYVVGDVWKEIDIKPCKVSDIFLQK